MDIDNDITEKVNELGQDALQYFLTINPKTGQPFVPDVTRQKIAGWKRSGKFPIEAYRCFYANECQAAETEPTPPVPQPPRQSRPTPPQFIPNAPSAPFRADPNVELVDEHEATVHPVMPGVKLATPGTGERFSGMSVVEPPANQRQPEFDADPGTVAAVIAALQQMGIVPKQLPQPPAPRAPRMDPDPPMKGIRRRHWNEPKPIPNGR